MAAESALDVVLGLRLEDGRTWGEAATDVQRRDAEAILDEKSGIPYTLITRSRGYSKTTDLGAVAIGVLLAQASPGSKSFAVAADQSQARLLIDAVEGFVRRTPGLPRLLDVQAWKVAVRSSGATLEALAADGASIWGLLPYFVVADELAEWGTTGAPRRVWDAIVSAIPKTSGRLVAITTAGSPSHWSARVRDHAARDPLWRLSETPGPPPWMPEELIEEQRRRLLPSVFERLFENGWTAPDDVVANMDDITACVRLAGPLAPQPQKRYLVCADLGVVNDASCVVVAHAEQVREQIDSLGREAAVGTNVFIDRLQTWKGSRASPVDLAVVERFILEASQVYNRAEVVLDVWQALAMAQRLRSRGVRVTEFAFTQQSISRLATTLHRLIRDRALWLPDDEALRQELASVRLIERAPNVYRIDHAVGEHDDMAIAVGMASTSLLEGASAIGPPLDAPTFGVSAPHELELAFADAGPLSSLLDPPRAPGRGVADGEHWPRVFTG